MQILKDEVRRSIHQAALIEFRENGYEKSSMRNIAERAGITAGNMYRYFKNKEGLFYSVISPAYEKVMKFITEQKTPPNYDKELENINVDIQTRKLVGIYIEHKDELLIIIEGSRGSKYENAKQEIINLVEGLISNMLKYKIQKNGITVEYSYLAHVLSVSTIEGVILIFKHCQDDEKVMERVQRFVGIIFKDIEDRIV